MATDWENAGLPLPSREGYAYAGNFGGARTPMRSGKTRQRRRWKDGNAIVALSFNLPRDMLYAFEAFLAGQHDADQESTWFTMPLITGDNLTDEAEPYSVRLIDDVSYGNLYGESITATMEVEYYPATIIVDPPFPVDLQSPSDGQVFTPVVYGGTLTRTDYTLIHITCGYSYEGENWIALESLEVATPLVYGGENVAPPWENGAIETPLFYGGTYTLDADGVFAEALATGMPTIYGGDYIELEGDPALSAGIPTIYGGDYIELEGDPALSADAPTIYGGTYEEVFADPDLGANTPQIYGGAHDEVVADPDLGANTPRIYGGSYTHVIIHTPNP